MPNTKHVRVRGNADYNNSRVATLLASVPVGALRQMDASDWYDLAATALDQAGFSVRDQERFQALLERPEGGTL